MDKKMDKILETVRSMNFNDISKFEKEKAFLSFLTQGGFIADEYTKKNSCSGYITYEQSVINVVLNDFIYGDGGILDCYNYYNTSENYRSDRDSTIKEMLLNYIYPYIFIAENKLYPKYNDDYVTAFILNIYILFRFARINGSYNLHEISFDMETFFHPIDYKLDYSLFKEVVDIIANLDVYYDKICIREYFKKFLNNLSENLTEYKLTSLYDLKIAVVVVNKMREYSSKYTYDEFISERFINRKGNLRDRHKKMYYSDFLISDYAYYRYIENKLDKLNVSDKIYDEIFTMICDFKNFPRYILKTVLNNDQIENSFFYIFDYVFDSDTYLELYTKLKRIIELSNSSPYMQENFFKEFFKEDYKKKINIDNKVSDEKELANNLVIRLDSMIEREYNYYSSYYNVSIDKLKELESIANNIMEYDNLVNEYLQTCEVTCQVKLYDEYKLTVDEKIDSSYCETISENDIINDNYSLNEENIDDCLNTFKTSIETHDELNENTLTLKKTRKFGLFKI